MLRKISVIPAMALAILFSFAVQASAGDAAKKAEKWEGTVSSVDAEGMRLVVKNTDGVDVEVHWDEKTQLAWMTDSKEASATPPTPSDISASTKVTVSCEKNAEGKMVASAIWIHPAAGGT